MLLSGCAPCAIGQAVFGDVWGGGGGAIDAMHANPICTTFGAKHIFTRTENALLKEKNSVWTERKADPGLTELSSGASGNGSLGGTTYIRCFCFLSFPFFFVSLYLSRYAHAVPGITTDLQM